MQDSDRTEGLRQQLRHSEALDRKKARLEAMEWVRQNKEPASEVFEVLRNQEWWDEDPGIGIPPRRKAPPAGHGVCNFKDGECFCGYTSNPDEILE